MKLKTLFFFIGFLAVSSSCCVAQKGYAGTVITKFGDTLNGVIKIKMDKPNDEMIEISTSTVEKAASNGGVAVNKSTGGSKINVAFIKYLVIDDSIFYFRDVKVENQTSKYNRNMCLRLTWGSLKNGIFQIGNSSQPEKAVISLPGKNNTYLVSPQDDYYAETGTWSLLEYSDCPPLKNKISAKQPGYTWNKKMALEERLALWRNWIAEYENCIPK